MGLDTSLRNAIRDVVKDELRAAVREELRAVMSEGAVDPSTLGGKSSRRSQAGAVRQRGDAVNSRTGRPSRGRLTNVIGVSSRASGKEVVECRDESLYRNEYSDHTVMDRDGESSLLTEKVAELRRRVLQRRKPSAPNGSMNETSSKGRK
jgi:hypothetical protein